MKLSGQIDNDKRISFSILSIAFILSFIKMAAFADDCSGCRKFDVGPVYLQIDVLEHGKTENRMELWGFKSDLSYVFSNGFAVKPTLLYATGDGYITNSGLGLGWYIPINDKITIGPFIGLTYSYIKTKTDLPQFFLEDVKEQFQSLCGFLACEAIWCFMPSWRLIFLYQYGFCRTRTKLEVLPGKVKGHSEGANYGVMLENDLTEKWSINIGFGYNISLSKVKHGLRGKGIKFGLAYWF